MLQAVPIREHTKGSTQQTDIWGDLTAHNQAPPGAPQEPGQFPARLIFRPLSEMLTEIKQHPTSLETLTIPLRGCRQRGWRSNPAARPQRRTLRSPIPEHHRVFEHVMLRLSLFRQQRVSLKNNELFPSRPALSSLVTSSGTCWNQCQARAVGLDRQLTPFQASLLSVSREELEPGLRRE